MLSVPQTVRRRRDPRSRRRRGPAESYLRGGQGGARLLGERTKRLRVAHGDVGQDLPVDFDAGEAESVDEDAVAHVVLTSGRVDAHDPETTEIALLVLAIAVGILPAP